MFNRGFFLLLKGLFDKIPLSLHSDTIKGIKACIDNLFASVANQDYQRHLMDEFDLRKESENLDDAKKAASALQEIMTAPTLLDGSALVELAVPSVCEVSADGSVLLTEWVDGQNITDYIGSPKPPPDAQVQRDFLYVLTRYYFNDLLRRKRLHMDLHPGNIIIQDHADKSGLLRVYLLDMGDELTPTDDEAQIMGRLLSLIHMEERGRRLEECEAMWRSLGVSSHKRGSEQFYYFSNSFDLIGGMQGLNWQENKEHHGFVTAPAQVALWQKATSAFVMTLQALRRKFPEWQVEASVQNLVRDALSEVLAQSPLAVSARTKPDQPTAAGDEIVCGDLPQIFCSQQQGGRRGAAA